MEVDAPSTASTGASLTSAPAMDDFYNAVGKAPHLDTIVPKESDWWAARKERKRRKA